MINFVTHFDHVYQAQGQCMLNSLGRHVGEHVSECIVWCDEKYGFGTINRWLRNVTDLRSWDRLEPLQKSRSRSAWFWSLEPAIVDHFLHNMRDGDILMYVDADQFFFADPIPAIRKALPGNDDIPLSCGPAIIALSPHHFPKGKEKPSVGRFNFGIGCFRACRESRQIVSEWLDQVIEQCDEVRNDQQYLDEWPAKLGDRLAELPEGINVGPWQAPVVEPDTMRIVSGNGSKLISYHFHETRRGIGKNPAKIGGEDWNLTNYFINASAGKYIYQPYIEALEQYL